MILEGVLVDLVPFSKVYQERMVGWRNGALRDWWPDADGLRTRAQHHRREEQRQTESGGYVRFGIQTKAGQPIGIYVLASINPYHRTAEIGAGIGDPAYWGGGYGSDAMLLLVDYAFRWLDLRRLHLKTMGHNLRAQRQVEKCGFTYEACCRQQMFKDGQFRDQVYYGLMYDEWPGRETMVERLGLHEKTQKATE